MNRWEVYWDVYKSTFGQEKRIPVMIMDIDANENPSTTVHAVKLTIIDRLPNAFHVTVGREAWNRESQIGACVVLCDTLTAFKKNQLFGPVAMMTSEESKKKIETAIMAQFGFAPMPPIEKRDPNQLPQKNWYATPRYTGAMGQETRQTYPQTPIPPAPYGVREVDYTHHDTQTVPNVNREMVNDSITKMYGKPETEGTP